MSKIKDWLVHLFGGKTEDEYKLMQKSRDYYYKLYKLNCYGYEYEYRAKCAAINQARKWKREYESQIAWFEKNAEDETKFRCKFNELKAEYNELYSRSYQLELRRKVLAKNIIQIDGIPEEYAKNQVIGSFAAELAPYIKFLKQEIYDPLTAKKQTNLIATLEVIKPNE